MAVLFENDAAPSPRAPSDAPDAISIGDSMSSGNLAPHLVGSRYESRSVTCSPKQLHLHPALHEIGLHDGVAQLDQAAKSGSKPVATEPVLITMTGIVLSGFGRWQLANCEAWPQINCIEYPLDERQALEFILRQHQVRRGWNAFVRVELALKLEPSFQREALANQQAGGKYKGLAILPEAQQIDVRKKVAESAGVCARNVGKAKEILKNAHPRLIEALRCEVLSINRAAKLCSLPKNRQVIEVTEHAWQREASKVIRQSVSRLKLAQKPDDTISVLDALRRQEEEQPGSVEIRISHSSRTLVVLGKDLLATRHSELELKLL